MTSAPNPRQPHHATEEAPDIPTDDQPEQISGTAVADAVQGIVRAHSPTDG